jgi:hypothetical protein
MPPMKNHRSFFETYSKIEDEKERLGFLRGYLFGLNPKELTRFMTDNFNAGILAYEQVLSTGNPQEIAATKAELDLQFAFLEKRYVAVAS